MSKRTRNQYSDDFRTTAVLMLESQGYPERLGALSEVARHLHVPLSTLRGWFHASRNPAPAQMRNIKKADLREMIREEINAALLAMQGQRDIASYRDLGTVFGIMVDKLQLLDGEPTARIKHEDWRDEAIAYIKAGELSYQALANEFDHELARDLFRSAGVPIEVAPGATSF